MNEIMESKHYDKSEGFEVTVVVPTLQEVMSAEWMAWIAFCVQRALIDPSSVPNVTLPSVQITNLFDNVQVLKVTSCPDADKQKVTVHYHWVQRFAERLKSDAQKEAVKRAKEELERQLEAEKEAEKKAFLNHIKEMMIAKEEDDRISTITKFANNA